PTRSTPFPYTTLFRSGEEKLKSQGMLTLEEFAARPIELEIILKNGADAFYAQVEAWLDDERMALTAIRMLCLLPDPRSERLLRRDRKSTRLNSSHVKI